MNFQNPQISIVSPLYNESETFPFLIERLNNLMDNSPLSIEIVLVDDGSKDNTAQLMQALALSDQRYQCVFLARNHGHQLALTAGLESALGTEAIMVIDGDLQDPPELLDKLYHEFKAGYDVVYAIRKKRKENFIKRSAYFMFYRLFKSISYIDIPLDTGDFSLMSRRVVDVLNKMPEESRFIRGMRTWVGFKQKGLEYDRDERIAGNSKYSFSMLFKLAFNGIFNFSEFPIVLLSKLGIFSIVISLIYFFWVLIKKFFFAEVIEGFTSLLFVIILFSGVQLIGLGILGQYVLRIFFQSKGRPLFVVKDKIINKTFQQ
ncbi:MAG: glycosyltransferase family 2 protein [Pseudarcicella sp.]|nr:glycosyltransferase family 2 protein [Pseudarcicella sp.]MBP6410950.1 glycosyltransferase family 2 protein [Pseudarcicella sp.]